MRRVFCIFLVMFLLIPAVSAGERPKFVALTFDDGPSGRYTTALLDGLESREVSATFFLCGYRLETYPELAARIRQQGHEIGLHGYTHDNMAKMTRQQIRKELEDTLALIPKGYYVNLMRPPGGRLTDQVHQVSQQMNLSIVHWSVDPRDWATDCAAQVEELVLAEADDGDIILLHDMTTASVEAALDIVDVLLQQDYVFVTVSELARLRGIRPRPGVTYKKFPREESPMK